jgi:hypothetical protein
MKSIEILYHDFLGTSNDIQPKFHITWFTSTTNNTTLNVFGNLLLHIRLIHLTLSIHQCFSNYEMSNNSLSMSFIDQLNSPFLWNT